MKRGPSMAFGMAFGMGLCVLPAQGLSNGSAPRVPFSGIYGGTAGAGSILGWDRAGGGDNPAVLGAPGWTASVAGYAPFGLEGVRVTEALVAWDRARWGLSAVYRGLIAEEPGGVAAGIGLQSALKLGRGWTTGIAADYRAEPGSVGAGGSLGLLWRPRSWGSLGAFGGFEDSPWGLATRAGAGADGGVRLAGMAWRLCAEALYARAGERGRWETRFATGVRLHALLSVYAGWDPPREMAALGVRFGIGDWEGFSAMRRHASLGGSSLQGIRWYGADAKSTEYLP